MTRRLCHVPFETLMVACVCLSMAMPVCFGDESPESPLPQPRMHAMPPRGQHQQQFAMPPLPGGPMPMNAPMPGMPMMPPIAGMPHAGHHQPAFGIVTGPVGPQLQAQLNLPDGMGLIVEHLDPAGAAAAAGIKRFDILRKFDDQILCSPEQLAALAKAAGKGKEVTLTVIREAQEREVAVTLGDSKARPGDWPAAGPVEAQALAHAGGGAQAGAHAGPGGRWRTHQTQHVDRVVSESNERGTVEIRETNGHRTVKVRNATGQELYSGPLNTDVDWQSVPADFQEMARAVAGKFGG